MVDIEIPATYQTIKTKLEALVAKKHYTKTETNNLLNNKVDKLTGKSLSTNDFTNTLLNKLNGIETEANKTVIDSALDNTSSNPVANSVITDELDLKADFQHSHTINDISTPLYSASQIDILLQNITGDTATDVMDKIGMWYTLRNETVHNITSEISNYWQGIMDYGLSSILQDFIIDGTEGVYEISNYANIPTDLFYFYDGTTLHCLTPLKINIQCSNYNLSIDSNVTVTVMVTDMFDNPIPYENIPLTITSSGNSNTVQLITNQNGIATYTYNCSYWGVCRFSVKTYATYINITGTRMSKLSTWEKAITTLYVNEASRTVSLTVYSNSCSIGTGTSVLHTEIIPSKYRPYMTITQIENNQQISMWINNSGSIAVRNLKGTALSNFSYYMNFNWSY